MDGQFEKKYGSCCCFCNQGIVENKTDPLNINIMHNIDVLNKTGREQIFYAHFDCFRDRLHQYFKGYFIRYDDEDEQTIESQDIKFIKNTKYLIQKIIELENINQWNVIYYGLKYGRIDTQFILNYCYAILEQTNCSDPFVIEIAGITNENDLYNLPETIAEKINNPVEILIDKDQNYSKIWSYLLLATDLCAEKIIK